MITFDKVHDKVHDKVRDKVWTIFYPTAFASAAL